MKHTVIREQPVQPVQPPVAKIVLELTPSEFLNIFVAIDRSSNASLSDTASPWPYRYWACDFADNPTLYGALLDAAIEAGVVRP